MMVNCNDSVELQEDRGSLGGEIRDDRCGEGTEQETGQDRTGQDRTGPKSGGWSMMRYCGR